MTVKSRIVYKKDDFGKNKNIFNFLQKGIDNRGGSAYNIGVPKGIYARVAELADAHV